MPTKSFEYLPPNRYYFDTACQALRPVTVVEAELEYYTQNNACGGRGNYPWAKQVDERAFRVRQKILDYLGKTAQEYVVAFSPNTTYGINLILDSLNLKGFEQVTTTEKEHNSVFLPLQGLARRNNLKLAMIPRDEDGQIIFTSDDFEEKSLVLLQSHSNIDGQSAGDLKSLANLVHMHDGLVMLDAAQSLAHEQMEWNSIDFDCLFASSHKMYGASLGFLVIKRDLIKSLDQKWVGGGTVDKIGLAHFEFISDENELHSRLELGLQDYGAIFALEKALDYLKGFKISEEYEGIDYQPGPLDKLKDKLWSTGPSREIGYYMESLSELVYVNLKKLEEAGLLKLLNTKTSPILSFVPRNIGSYELTQRLGESGIMCRSGYMCAHFYLQEVLRVQPITRIALGLHNTPADIAFLLTELEKSLV
jgi:selenocysteine lyase/cysteine desulfurase